MQLPDSCAQPTLLVPSEAHPTLGSALEALAASSASATTIRLAAGVYHEEGPLHLCRGVSLVGAGRDTVLESEGTVLVCDGAALVSDISVRQVGGDASVAAYGIEVRSSLLVERCDVAASCGAECWFRSISRALPGYREISSSATARMVGPKCSRSTFCASRRSAGGVAR